MGKTNLAYDRLYEIAADQQGYFTTKQQSECAHRQAPDKHTQASPRGGFRAPGEKTR